MIQLLIKKKHGSSLSSSVSWMWCQVLVCSLDDKTNSCLSCFWQLSKAIRVCQHDVLLCLVDYWILLDHCQRSSSPYRSPAPLLVCKLTTHLFLAVALLWQIHFSHTFALTNCECPIVKMQALCGVFSIRCIFCCILRGTCVCHWYCCLLLPTVYYCYSLRSCWPGALSSPLHIPLHLSSPSGETYDLLSIYETIVPICLPSVRFCCIQTELWYIATMGCQCQCLQGCLLGVC
jgi:hypothetical protein